MLGKVKYLNLGNCSCIRDVSKLGNVRTLILKNCSGIRDVSMLGNVELLDLRHCYNLGYNDIRMLRTVKKLYL